jgi:hypothetical protein
MIRLRVAPFALLALLATPAFADQTERLRFAAEANRAEVAARLEGAEGRDLLVAALAGQRMTVEMTTTNPSAYFNVWAPSAGAAMFIGSSEGLRFEGVLPVDGDYRVQTYLMRNAALRGQTADIRLSIAIPAAGTAASPAPDVADGLAGGPDFWEVHGVGAGDRLNLRAGPSARDRVLGRVADGAILRNLGCAMTGGARWCQVRAEALGLTGWAAGRFLREGAPLDATAAAPSDASGTLPCVQHRGQPSAPCAFIMRRSAPGEAQLIVTFAGAGSGRSHSRAGGRYLPTPPFR